MAGSTTTTAKDEPKERLFPGDPQAGYVSPDLSLSDGAGTLSEAEQAWHDDRDDARKEEADTVADAEDKAAKERKANAEKSDDAATKTTTKASTGGSSSTPS